MERIQKGELGPFFAEGNCTMAKLIIDQIHVQFSFFPNDLRIVSRLRSVEARQ